MVKSGAGGRVAPINGWPVGKFHPGYMNELAAEGGQELQIGGISAGFRGASTLVGRTIVKVSVITE
jgi:hypothetical protein